MPIKIRPYAIRAVRGETYIVEYHEGYFVFLARQWAYWMLEYKVETWRESE